MFTLKKKLVYCLQLQRSNNRKDSKCVDLMSLTQSREVNQEIIALNYKVYRTFSFHFLTFFLTISIYCFYLKIIILLGSENYSVLPLMSLLNLLYLNVNSLLLTDQYLNVNSLLLIDQYAYYRNYCNNSYNRMLEERRRIFTLRIK